jgi:hypothetical protein
VNMTQLSTEKIQQAFKKANGDLSQFYLEKMSMDWVKHFGGDAESAESVSGNPEAMKHLAKRVESDMNTFDISGRTG